MTSAEESTSRSMWLPEVARRQGMVFTTRQVLEAGLSRGQVQRRLASGVWKRVVGTGIRRAGDSPNSWMLVNSVRLTWPDAVVIGPAAALFHGAPLPVPTSVDVWRPQRGSAPCRGVIPRDIPLGSDEWNSGVQFNVTSPHRSLIDALAWLPLDEARNLAAWIFTRGRLERTHLEARLRDRPGMHGNGQIRRLLDETRDGALSVAEQLLIRLLRRAGIRGWKANVRIRDARGVIGVVDLLFEDARLVIEVDGRAAHATRFQSDRTRDNRLAMVGYTVLRFTWQDLTQRQGEVLTTIRKFTGVLHA